jgi:hypothetical protein
MAVPTVIGVMSFLVDIIGVGYRQLALSRYPFATLKANLAFTKL